MALPILLLGAGFTHNLGGLLASRFMGQLSGLLTSRPELNEKLRMSGKFRERPRGMP